VLAVLAILARKKFELEHEISLNDAAFEETTLTQSAIMVTEFWHGWIFADRPMNSFIGRKKGDILMRT